MLLEGLWRNWGFYFTACTQPDGVGSSDLEQVLRDLKHFRRLKPISIENRDTVLVENRELAARRSLLLLFVRMFIFRAFLECASETPGGITENHKGRWLLVQVAPHILLRTEDIFFAFTRLMGRASYQYLEEAIALEHVRVKCLGPKPGPLFCVLDEAQVPANEFSNCFQSEAEQFRPILHEIIPQWTKILPNLIVSGTGVSMQEVGNVLGSVVAKEGDLLPTMTSIGGFDNMDDQRAYLQHYLPPGFLDTTQGEEIARRAGYWLRGRFV